jgi:hypothetical protein
MLSFLVLIRFKSILLLAFCSLSEEFILLVLLAKRMFVVLLYFYLVIAGLSLMSLGIKFFAKGGEVPLMVYLSFLSYSGLTNFDEELIFCHLF